MGADCMCCCGCTIIMCAVVSALIGAAIHSTIHSLNYEYSKVVSLYVQDLYVATTTPTTTFNGSVLVELKFERQKALCELDYKDFEMTLLYEGSGIGSSVVEGFSMRREMKRVDVIGKVEAAAMPWQETLLPGNVGTMVVELRWPSDDSFSYTAHATVDASGHMKVKEPIQFEFYKA